MDGMRLRTGNIPSQGNGGDSEGHGAVAVGRIVLERATKEEFMRGAVGAP